MSNFKTCNKCFQTYKITMFHKSSTSKDGRRNDCKYCRSKYKQKIRMDRKRLNLCTECGSSAIGRLCNKCNNKKNTYERNFSIEQKLRARLRQRLYRALNQGYKIGSAISNLGCSIEFLRIYLEHKFQNGMTWENYGEWHIDHIVPLSNFNLSNEDELLKACHYTNLQPLWAKDNLSKSNKFTT